ncbi:MAG: hypothetical protein O3A80_04550 [bacterium]|nr:hypothetical protein [bacterium]MDA1292665.1 hypothetical protein [bacterium]
MQTASVTGKIILSGEYAVLFGYQGIAVPAPLTMTVTFAEDTTTKDLTIEWAEVAGHHEWQQYLMQIIHECGKFGGKLTIENQIPLGKGMGSSTALVIAVCKCLLGEDCEQQAKQIEDTVNPGNSGIDFAVIWNNQPILFSQDKPYQLIDILINNPLKGALLIDTGEPDQQTPELIKWVTERKDELSEPLSMIGSCTDRLLSGEDLREVLTDHNTAQQSLGIVTDKAKELITKIEQEGGAAKVLGAGSRTGGCGMVLAIGIDTTKIDSKYPIIPLPLNY